MNTASYDTCGVRWCREKHGHDRPHRSIEYDVNGIDVATGRPVVLQAVRQGESARVSACVLVCEVVEVGLTWPQVLHLSRTLAAMARTQPDTI